MTDGPTFDEIFAVMAAASVGDANARVEIPAEPSLDHLPTRFAIALNILLDDLAAHNERRLQALLDSVQDYAILMVDAGGQVSSWNAGAARVLGYAGEEIIGHPVVIFYPPEDRAKAGADLETARDVGRVELEGWRVRQDGSRFWANVVTTAVKDESGQVVGYAKIMRDLTERMRAEEAVRRANQELEAFSYSVAHDLRAPLRAINGFAELVVDDYGDKVDAEGKRWLQAISLGTKKMAALIDGLLLLAHLTRSSLERGPIDLVPLIRDIVGRLRSASGGSDRDVVVVVPEHLEAHGDPRLVRSLLDNLLANAWKFTGQTEEARIEVGWLPPTEREPHGAYFVRDNGAGFDMAFVGKLFGAFQRLHPLTEFPGDGIGLATAARIVRRHGGRIWAEGKVGSGATFYFTLPPPGRA